MLGVVRGGCGYQWAWPLVCVCVCVRVCMVSVGAASSAGDSPRPILVSDWGQNCQRTGDKRVEMHVKRDTPTQLTPDGCPPYLFSPTLPPPHTFSLLLSYSPLMTLPQLLLHLSLTPIFSVR